MIHAPISVDENIYRKRADAIPVDDLIRTHQQLVRRIAWQVHSGMSSSIQIEDLIQIGLVALIEAARCFEERGAPFAAYASTRIRGAMIDQLRREAHIGRQGISNRKRLAATRKKLEDNLCRAASGAELAKAMDMDADEYFAFVGSSTALQFDAIDDVYNDSNSWFMDLSETPEQELVAKEVEQKLAHAIAKLDKRSALVLQLYFKEEMNLAEIAATLDVSAPRVCQIKKEALDRVKHLLGGALDD
jgi:RNA polymerase sigma factor for flagellar operon FliA